MQEFEVEYSWQETNYGTTTVKADNYDDAEEELYNLIVDAIDEEREWAKKVLVESETDNWDKYQIENASKILNLIDESRDN